MEWQINDIYVVQDKKTGLLVLDEERYVDKCRWYKKHSNLYHNVKDLEEIWCIQYHYNYLWYADYDSGTDRNVSGIVTCPVGCETTITDYNHEGRNFLKTTVYAVGDGQKCIGFLQKVSEFHDYDEWHFFDLGNPETHEWEFGTLVLKENASKDYENVY